MEEEYVEEFIACVKEREILWNLCHPQYKNIKKKAQEWQKIADKFGLSIDVVKKKWKALRDSYSRSLNRKKSSAQAGDEPEYTSKYGDLLEFLKKHMKPRITISNYCSLSLDDTAIPSPQVTPREGVDYEGACNGLLTTAESVFVAENPFCPRLSQGASPSRAAKKRQASAMEDTYLSTMQSVQEFLKKPRVTAFSTSPGTNLEDELFCGCLLEKLKTFPLQQRNEAKIGMLKYLSDLQVKNSKTKVNRK